MKKIVIIGSPGAGKSTLAQALAHILNIEVFHLDRYFWQYGWKEYPRETRIKIEQQLIGDKDRWIIEGTYFSSSDSRLQAADTIIFLDMPPLFCFWQAVKRHIRYRGCSRPDIPDGCTDRLGLLYILKILVFPRRGKKLLLRKFAEIPLLGIDEPQKKTILTFRSHQELDDFLLKLSSQQQEAQASYEEHGHPQEPVAEEAKECVLTTT
ncbi:MAG: topology modulation protein [Ktedonobacteraceae bacterium]